MSRLQDAGGTSGGLGEFVAGVLMTAAGFYVLADRITVHSGWGRFWQGGHGGLTLIAVLIGFILVFYNGRNPLGWLLVVGGIGFSLLEVLSSLSLSMRPMPLWEMLLIFVLFGGGIGLTLKAIRPHRVSGELEETGPPKADPSEKGSEQDD